MCESHESAAIFRVFRTFRGYRVPNTFALNLEYARVRRRTGDDVRTMLQTNPHLPHVGQSSRPPWDKAP